MSVTHKNNQKEKIGEDGLTPIKHDSKSPISSVSAYMNSKDLKQEGTPQ